MAEAGRRTTSRRDLSRNDRFEELSPEVGVLDENALDAFMDEDPDEALSLLADLAGATDRSLADQARRLAARITIAMGRTGVPRSGIGRLRPRPVGTAEGDLDLDASMDALVAGNRQAGSRQAGDEQVAGARVGDRHPGDRQGAHPVRPTVGDPAALRVSAWTRHDTALCLLVDRSGSMAGDRLATAAVATAAVLHRLPRDSSVVCFSDQAVVVKSQDAERSTEEVLGDVFTLRGFGITDLGLALRTAANQLSRSSAARRVAVVLSDCRATAGGDPLPHATGIDEVVVLAPADDSADAEAFADALGARWAPVAAPSGIPEAFSAVLGQ